MDEAAAPLESGREPLIRRSDSSSCPESLPKRDRHVFRLSTLAKYCLLLEFLVEFSNNVLTVPIISLFENAICETYYHGHSQNVLGMSKSIDESLCKIPPVQAELATLRGWKAFFETISGMLNVQRPPEAFL